MTDKTLVTSYYTVADPKAEHPLHGVFGGVTPQGDITASFFSERSAIPKELDLVVPNDSDGNIAGIPEEGERRGKMGIVRTVTSTYYFNADMAESVGNWSLQKAAERRAYNGNR